MENNQDDNSKRVSAAELKKLDVFLGKWKISGKNFPAAPNEPETALNGEDSYDWLSGKFFIVSHWRHSTKNGGHEGISVLGYDSDEKKLFTRNFDNIGFERKYFIVSENNEWKFAGSQEKAVRKFSEDGNSYVEHWEVLQESGKWEPLCVMNGTRI